MDLIISIIQTNLIWQNPQANMDLLSSKIEALPARTQLIILPEMFTTGFSMDVSLAEEMDSSSMNWMRQMAIKASAVITGSIMIQQDGHVFNRLIWMRPDGTYECYDKRHLFRMANEHEHFDAGNSRPVFEINSWKICPLICYDLRFPVWSRNQVENELYDYDLLIYVANWPERRTHAWKSLLVARAIENQSFVAGVNRVGLDGNDVSYSGDSIVLNYLGEAISREAKHADFIETITISRSELDNFRKTFPAGLDADKFTIKL
jgi:omega-amidase